jgi:hypothetical protein
MSQRNTLVRSMHDVGLAAWFGGSLMGAVGLNGATAAAKDPRERLSLSSLGWGRWAPVNTAAIGVHAVGGLGLILGNKGRLTVQGEGQANTAVKTVVTGAALAVTAYSGMLGRKVAKLSSEGGEGATEPAPGSSRELANAQRQLRLCQWAIPALTGVLVVMGAQQGEQQRPLAGLVGRDTLAKAASAVHR